MRKFIRSTALRSCGVFLAGFFGLVLASAVPAQQNSEAAPPVITTYAGGGPDGLPGISANLPTVGGLSVDANGTIYIASFNGNRVFMMDSKGKLRVVAGSGMKGFAGDGGPARNASFNYPLRAVADGYGNVFIADYYNYRVRRVDGRTGVITTVAGDGEYGFSGDTGPATSARLSGVIGLATDGSGNLYIADGSRIRRVDASTGVITTVAGNGSYAFSGDGGAATSASLNSPWGVAVDRSGNLFIADTNNSRIRRVDTNGIITTVAGGSLLNGRTGYCGDGAVAVSACLNFPLGVALDDDGNIFIADNDNGRIRRVDVVTKIITTAAGNGLLGFAGDGGPAAAASFTGPVDVAVDNWGNLFVADAGNLRVRRVDASAMIATVAGNGYLSFSGDGYLASAAALNPLALASDSQGNLFIVDGQDSPPNFTMGNQRIRKVNAATRKISTVAGNGTRGFSGDNGPAIQASLKGPRGIAVDSKDNLFIADAGNYRIRKIDGTTGTISTVAGNGTRGNCGDGGPAIQACLGLTRGLSVDSNGNVFFIDGSLVRRVDSAGTIATVAGKGSCSPATGFYHGDGGPAIDACLNLPMSTAVDSQGNLFIADYGNAAIRRVDSSTGIITTVAGIGQAGFSGDGGLAIEAMLDKPAAVTLDAQGNLFIADTLNHRIRRVDAATGVITTVAGNGAAVFGVDRILPTDTSLPLPTALSWTSTAGGKLFIGDTVCNRVRVVGRRSSQDGDDNDDDDRDDRHEDREQRDRRN